MPSYQNLQDEYGAQWDWVVDSQLSTSIEQDEGTYHNLCERQPCKTPLLLWWSRQDCHIEALNFHTTRQLKVSTVLIQFSQARLPSAPHSRRLKAVCLSGQGGKLDHPYSKKRPTRSLPYSRNLSQPWTWSYAWCWYPNLRNYLFRSRGQRHWLACCKFGKNGSQYSRYTDIRIPCSDSLL